ncbi:MAG: protein adenylyltransferase SelO family protein [Corynebacterium sp.]|uniref:protein adenylyltransferase SelO n=1 Tax=Corynebacterium sp. TaxID=1720 RepID=UPI0026DB94DF|nr:protein adenylyltransferase SelO family protein [Corynebacterium sp.]MDO5098003.1 protein adenylyltransferase SelO family protein [Corynebacterium sp.]
MNPHVELKHDLATALPWLVSPARLADFPQLEEVVVNSPLGQDLNLPIGHLHKLLVMPGHAMAYSGHQFGQFVPLLGDGRAVLLGEVPVEGRLVDLHVKGSGRTVFSRGGDGLAPLGPMLREFLLSEALHGLGVATSRSLAVFRTGGQVQRRQAEPGALLVRVADSHIRVGSFQFAALRGVEEVAALADYVIARHFPGVDYVGMLSQIVRRQAVTVAKWMRFGFVHGVLNSDNTTVSGETIDFGPCAFTDVFDSAAVFSSIDAAGRYRFGNQPSMVGWNIARLAESLIPLIGVTAAEEAVREFGPRYHQAFYGELAAALGLRWDDSAGAVSELIDDFLVVMQTEGKDITLTFRQLAEHHQSCDFDPGWLRRWRAFNPDLAQMQRINPVYIARNHLVENALSDMAEFHKLWQVLRNPTVRRPGCERFEQPTPEGFGDYVTYCGT